MARTTQAVLIGLHGEALISANGTISKNGTPHPGLVLNIIAICARESCIMLSGSSASNNT